MSHLQLRLVVRVGNLGVKEHFKFWVKFNLLITQLDGCSSFYEHSAKQFVRYINRIVVTRKDHLPRRGSSTGSSSSGRFSISSGDPLLTHLEYFQEEEKNKITSPQCP